MTVDEMKELKVGDYLYRITDIGVLQTRVLRKEGNTIYFEGVQSPYYIPVREVKNYFILKKDAENQYIANQNIKLKKKALYEYEKSLNEKYGLNTYIVKI